MKAEQELPKFFNNLSNEDQKSYLELRSYVSSKECRNNRGHRLTKFSEILNSIQKYCIRHDDDDIKRCMVCGVCWLPPKGIAINIRQLHLLLDKCKSSINGSFQRMGYTPLSPKNELVNQLIEYMPHLKNNFPELREWTIRTLTMLTPQPEVPSVFPQNLEKSQKMFNNGIETSISMGNISQNQNFSSFSSPQPNIFMNNFMTPPLQVQPQFVPQTQPENKTVPQKSFDLDASNSFNDNQFSNEENYFDDPFCLPPSTLFDESNGIEFPFDSWSGLQ